MTHTIVTHGMEVRTHTRCSYAATLTRTNEHMQEEQNSPCPGVDYHMTIAYLSSASDLEFLILLFVKVQAYRCDELRTNDLLQWVLRENSLFVPITTHAHEYVVWTSIWNEYPEVRVRGSGKCA